MSEIKILSVARVSVGTGTPEEVTTAIAAVSADLPDDAVISSIEDANGMAGKVLVFRWGNE